MFYFYILCCKDGTLYCGMAKNLKERELMHNSGRGSKYVRSRGGGLIVYSERYNSLNEAMRRESEVKKWPRNKKLALTKTTKQA